MAHLDESAMANHYAGSWRGVGPDPQEGALFKAPPPGTVTGPAENGGLVIL